MSIRWGVLRARARTGPFEPGPAGGLSFLSGKELDSCFTEVVRGILFGVGSCDSRQPPPSKQDLFTYACKALNVEKAHANKLVSSISSEVPSRVVNVKVLGARDLLNSPAGCGAFCKVRLVDDTEAQTSTLEDDVFESFERTKTCADSSNPEWNEELHFALTHPDSERLEIEIWTDPGASAAERRKKEETSVLQRFVKHFSTSPSVTETCLGVVQLHIQDIHPAAMAAWYPLDSQVSQNSACHLHISFNIENLPELERLHCEQLYRLVTRSFLRHQLRAHKARSGSDEETDSNSWWHFTPDAEYILSQFALQRCLPKHVQTALQAEAIIQLQTDRWMATDTLGKIYEELDNQCSRTAAEMSKDDERVVMQSLNTITDFIFGQFSVNSDLFPPKENSQLEDTLQLIELLQQLVSLATWKKLFPDRDMSELAVQAKLTVEARIKAWYLSSVEFSVSLCQELSGLSNVTQKFTSTLHELKQSLDKTPPVYTNILAGFGENYKKMCLQEAHRLIASDLEKFTTVAAQSLNKVLDAKTFSKSDTLHLSMACRRLRELFVITMELQHWLEKLQPPEDNCNRERSQALHWQKWFECLLPAWLKELQVYCTQFVALKLAQEKGELKASPDRFISSSATAVLDMLKELPTTWKEICSWPDPVVAFMIATRIVDIISDTVRSYVYQMHQEMLSWKLSKQSSALSKGTAVCLAVANMYSMQGALSRRLAWIDWEGIAQRMTGSHARQRAHSSSQTDNTSAGQSLVKGAQRDVALLMRRAAKDVLHEMTCHGLPEVMQQTITEARHLKNVSTDVSTAALQDYLHQFHILFHDSPGIPLPAYKVVVLELWDVVLRQIRKIANASQDEEPYFFRNLTKALVSDTGIMGFFRDVMDANLDHISLETPTFKEVHHQLLVEGSSSSDLTAYHYKELLLFQEHFHAQSRGHVTVTISHNAERISGQVRDGKKLPTVNGVCNPYILLELLPVPLFRQPSSWKSEVITNRTSPVFDFHFKSVLLDQACAAERAVLVVTIMHQTAEGQEDILLGHGVLPLSACLQPVPTQRSGMRHTLQLLIAEDNSAATLLSMSTLKRRSVRDVEASAHHAKLRTIVEMASISLKTSTPST